MYLDVNTLFMVTMNVEIILGLLLYFAWAQGFKKRALAWWGSAHLLRAVSIMLLGQHGSVPDSVSIDFANAVLFASFALTWSGARVFDRRKPELLLALAGVAVWLLACRLPSFMSAPEERALLGSGIVTIYMWLTAYEFWRGRDEALVSRWPAIFMLFAHGTLFLLRTPLGMHLRLPAGDHLALSGWLELLSLEGLLFTIAIAFILLAMAKERTEYRHRAAHAPTRSPASSTAVASWSRPPCLAVRRPATCLPHSCCSTSIISNRSTTATVTRLAITRCGFSRIPRRRMSARSAWSVVGAAMSSSPCSTTPPARSRRQSPNASSLLSRRLVPISKAAWSAPR
jgi:hypothetical protein